MHEVGCSPYDNISIEIGYHISVNKWMSYSFCLSNYLSKYFHLMAPDWKKDAFLNDETV